MQTVAIQKLNEISRFTVRQTGGFRYLPPDAKQRVLDRLGDDITAAKVKAAVAEVKDAKNHS